MKTKLLIIGLALGMYSNAQITVYSTNFINAGETYISATGPVVTTNTAPGANQTWNFAALDSSYGKDTLDFILPSATIFGSQFPTSTMAIFDPVDSFAQYFSKSTSSFNITGIADAAFFIKPTDPMTMINFPATYGTSNSDSYSFYNVSSGASVGSSADSVRITIYGTRHHKVDAWGNLTLPTGTFKVLRFKDTVFDYFKEEELNSGTWTVTDLELDTSYSNFYISNNIKSKYILLFQDLDENGVVTANEWNVVSPSLAGITENSAKTNFTVFPNPATNILNIKSNYSFNEYTITDIVGKVIFHKKEDNVSKIDISNLENGQYIVTLKSNEGVTSKKFIKK